MKYGRQVFFSIKIAAAKNDGLAGEESFFDEKFEFYAVPVNGVNSGLSLREFVGARLFVREADDRIG